MQTPRRFTRHRIDRVAKIKIGDSPEFLDCRIQDISFKGLQIFIDEKLPIDQYFMMHIVLAHEFTLDAQCWVTWHRSIDGYNIYGVYFNKITDSDKEKIYQFMHTHHTQELTKKWWQEKQEKGGEKMEDKRIFARFPAEYSLKFLDIQNGREGQAKTVDISAKGIGFESKEQVAAHTPVEMWLDMPDHGEPLYTRGEVVWSKSIEPNKFRAGVELEKADLMGLSRAFRPG